MASTTTELEDHGGEEKPHHSQTLAGEKKPVLGMRWIFAMLGFTANAIGFFNRNSFSVALVAMVNSTGINETQANYSRDACPAAVNNTYDDSSEETGEFHWTASQQARILGATNWGFLIMRLIGSRLGEVVGQRETIAAGIVVTGITQMLSPFAAELHPFLLIATRFIFGVAFGPIPSSMHSLISAWASPRELSTMVATVLAGSMLGGLIGFLAAAWLSEAFGWRSIFWIGGAICFIFTPFWLLLVRNSPSVHPLISDYEKRLLEQKAVKVKKKVPWLKILTSPFLYICVYAHFARVWVDFLVSMEGPSYFTYKIGLSLNQASYVCASNYFAQLIFIIVFGRISDTIINKNLVKRITARKIFHFIGSSGVGWALVMMALADCNAVTAVTYNILSGVFVDGTGSSYFVSVIDLAPNFAATFMGFFALGNLGAALTPIFTSILLNSGNGWNKSFYLAAGLNFLSCIIYIAFMTDEAQPWNFEDEEGDTDVEEKETNN